MCRGVVVPRRKCVCIICFDLKYTNATDRRFMFRKLPYVSKLSLDYVAAAILLCRYASTLGSAGEGARAQSVILNPLGRPT